MTCQRTGCTNPTKGPRARFCSGACKVAHHRKAKKPVGLIEEPPAPSTFRNILSDPMGLHDNFRVSCTTPNTGPALKELHRCGCREFENGTMDRIVEGVCQVHSHNVIRMECGCLKNPYDGSVRRITRDVCQFHKSLGQPGSRVLTEPCPPDCSEDPAKHIHVTMPGFATAKDQPRGIIASSGAPAGERMTLKPKPLLASPRVAAALDRSHAPGCPCWTCKGVPPKKKHEPKKR